MSVSLYALITQVVRWAWCAQLAGPGSSVSGSRLLKEIFHNLQNEDFLLLPAKHSWISMRIEEEYYTRRLSTWNFKEWQLKGRSAGIRRKLCYAEIEYPMKKSAKTAAVPSFTRKIRESAQPISKQNRVYSSPIFTNWIRVRGTWMFADLSFKSKI